MVKSPPVTTVIGPFWDVSCRICGESICDGEFEDTRQAARELAAAHAKLHAFDGDELAFAVR